MILKFDFEENAFVCDIYQLIHILESDPIPNHTLWQLLSEFGEALSQIHYFILSPSNDAWAIHLEDNLGKV